jgi:hypothetical protein
MAAFASWAASTGASFVPWLSNAAVVAVALALFAIFFTVSAFSGVGFLSDVAFLALVVGGILVSWPAMVVLSVSAVALLIVVSFAHRAIRPAHSAQIEAEAGRRAAPAVESLERELGSRRDQRR